MSEGIELEVIGEGRVGKGYVLEQRDREQEKGEYGEKGMANRIRKCKGRESRGKIVGRGVVGRESRGEKEHDLLGHEAEHLVINLTFSF